ncbi:MAG: alpha/beta hydrolase, partial [Pseudonocardiales bacterium]
QRLASLSAASVPHPIALVRAMATSRQGLASWYMYLFQLPALPEWVLLGPGGRNPRALARFLRASGLSDETTRREVQAMSAPGAMRGALNWYRAMPLTNPRSGRARITTPTMYVWGDADVAILRQTAEACRAWVAGPYRFEVLAGVSHAVPEDAPDALAGLLLQHFAGHPG